MKDKVLTLIIGILIGAILATAGFYIYTKITSNSEPQGIPTGDFREMKGERRMPDMQNENGQDGEMVPGGNKQKRNKQNGEEMDEEPPAKPADDSSKPEISNNNTESNS